MIRSNVKLKNARSKGLSRTGAAVFTVALVASPTAFGQVSAGPAETAGRPLEEIVVTAQKREQSLQDIGVTVNAFGRDSIRELGLTNTADVGRFTPNMTIRNTMGDFMPIISIRGVGSSTNDVEFVTAQPSSAVHVDEVYLGSPALLQFSNFDLERIEVLKGPQGTLYGRNTTAGTINYISAKPEKEFGAGIQAEYGSYDTGGEWIGLTGHVTGPLSDKLAGRLAFKYKEGDHFVEDFNGNPYEGADELSVRGLLNWRTDKADVLVNIHGGNSNPGNAPPQIYAVLPLVGAARGTCTFATTGVQDLTTCRPGSPPTNITQTDGTVVPFVEPNNPFDSNVWRNASSVPKEDRQQFDNFGASVKVKLDFGNDLTLTSITSTEDSDTYRFENFSGRDIPRYYDIRLKDDIKQFSEELRVSGSTNRAFWVAGVYYYTEEIENVLRSHFQSNAICDDPATPPPSAGGPPPESCPPGVVAFALSDQFRTQSTTLAETDTIAVFGQVDLNLTDAVKLTLGLRYTDDKKTFLRDLGYNFQRNANSDVLQTVGTTINPTTGVAAQVFHRQDPTVPLERDWQNTSFKIGLDYQLNDDVLLYGLVSTGFKAGVFNGSSLALPEALSLPADPEELTAFEFGAKTTAANGRLRLNVSAFYYDYRDLQIVSTVRTSNGDNSTVLDNAEKAVVVGLDADLAWVPTENLLFTAAIGLLDAEYDKFTSLAGDGVTVLDFSGLPLVNAPETTATVAGSYEWDLSGGSAVTLGADIIYNSEIDFDFRENPFSTTSNFDIARQALRSDATTVVNARLAWVNAEKNLTLALWGRNLGNEEVLTHTTFGVDEATWFYDAPRSVGLSVSYDF